MYFDVVSKDKLGRRRDKSVENPGGMRNTVFGIKYLGPGSICLFSPENTG